MRSFESDNGPVYQLDKGESPHDVGRYSPAIVNPAPINMLFHDPLDIMLRGHDNERWSTPIDGLEIPRLMPLICPDADAALFLAGYVDDDSSKFHVYGAGNSFSEGERFEPEEGTKPAFMVKFWYPETKIAAMEEAIYSGIEIGSIFLAGPLVVERQARNGACCYMIVPLGGGILPENTENFFQDERAKLQREALGDFNHNHAPHYHEADCYIDGVSFNMSYVIDRNGALVQPSQKREISRTKSEYGIKFEKFYAEVDAHYTWEPIPPGAMVVRIEYDGGETGPACVIIHDVDKPTIQQRRRTDMLFRKRHEIAEYAELRPF